MTSNLSGSPDNSADPAGLGLACPRCPDGRLEPGGDPVGTVACPRCGHRAAGAYVREQLWLEQQDRQLHARLDWVRDRVAEGGPVVPAPRPSGPAGSAVAGPASAGPAAARPRVAPGGGRPAVAVQTLLLAFGALLLVLAAVVFAAVAWDRLGAVGQVGVLAVLVAALSGAAHTLRSSYRGTAEALASIAAAVAVVALLAAPHLGLGAHWMRARPTLWAALAFAAVAGFGLLMARASALAAWHVAVAAAAVAAAFSLTLAAGGGSLRPVGCAALAVASAAVIRWQPGRAGPYRHEAPRIGAGLGALAVIAGWNGYAHLDQAGWWAAAWSVLALCAVASVLPRAAASVPRPVQVVGLLVAGLAAGQALALLLGGTGLDPWVCAPLLALSGGVLLALAELRRTVGTLPARTSAVVVWLVSLPVIDLATGLPVPPQSAYLGIVAGCLLAVSLLPGRTALAWAGAAVGSFAWWLPLGEHQVATMEVFTAGSAALLLVAGLLQRRSRPESDSMITLGPALAMAVLPSAVRACSQAIAGEDVPRAVLVILGGAVLAALGARLRLRACLVIGLLAVAVAGLGQVAALVDLVPRWVALAAAGALLLAAGFNVERLGRAGRHALRAARTLR